MRKRTLLPTAIGVTLGALAACDDSTAPPDGTTIQTRRDVQGVFVLVRAAGAPPEEICFEQIDPRTGDMIMLGLLTFDTTRSVVRQREKRRGCSGTAGPDTISVDQERPFRIVGTRVLIDRPGSAAASVVDTGTVVGETLSFRRNGLDWVYERVAFDDRAFYLRSSDLDAWMVGVGTFSSPNGTSWGLKLDPSHFTNNQRLGVARLTGRPPVGSYPLGHHTSAQFYASMDRDIPGGAQFFQSTTGTMMVTESTPARVQGSFVIDMVDDARRTTRVEGVFTARCSTRAGCP